MSILVSAGAVAAAEGKSLITQAVKTAIGCAIRKHREARFDGFLETLAQGGVTPEQIEAYLQNDAQAALLERVADKVIKSGTQISRLALGRILGDQISQGGRYRAYDAARAIEAVTDLDDVDARVLIAWVETSRRTSQKSRKALASRPMQEIAFLPVRWSDLEKYPTLIPDSVRNDNELREVGNRLVQRGVFQRVVGFTDYEGSEFTISEFGVKVKEELSASALACGYDVLECD